MLTEIIQRKLANVAPSDMIEKILIAALAKSSPVYEPISSFTFLGLENGENPFKMDALKRRFLHSVDDAILNQIGYGIGDEIKICKWGNNGDWEVTEQFVIASRSKGEGAITVRDAENQRWIIRPSQFVYDVNGGVTRAVAKFDKTHLFTLPKPENVPAQYAIYKSWNKAADMDYLRTISNRGVRMVYQHAYWHITCGNEHVGMMSLGMGTYGDPSKAEVRIYVEPDYRGIHIPEWLLPLAYNQAGKWGCDMLTAHPIRDSDYPLDQHGFSQNKDGFFMEIER